MNGAAGAYACQGPNVLPLLEKRRSSTGSAVCGFDAVRLSVTLTLFVPYAPALIVIVPVGAVVSRYSA